LTLCQRLLALMGGEIEVRSALEAGTTVSLTLSAALGGDAA
jgi:signal transduction histidine kinase